MNLEKLNLVELSAQEIQEVEGGLTWNEFKHYVKDWWENNGWFKVV
jgi:hypothetical protein